MVKKEQEPSEYYFFQLTVTLNNTILRLRLYLNLQFFCEIYCHGFIHRPHERHIVFKIDEIDVHKASKTLKQYIRVRRGLV